MSKQIKIVDAHMHFYDHAANKHTFLDEADPGFEAFVGDYSTLPRQYLPEDYLEDTQAYKIEGVIWHEFISTDPTKEARWAQQLAEKNTAFRQAMTTLVDFLDPQLEEKLEIYSTIPQVTAVREHMLWDDNNPLKRFAKRPDLLSDAVWQKQLGLLNQYHFKCNLEVFSSQLPAMIKVVQRYSNINFTLPAMGWPLDLSEAGYQHWQKNLKQLSAYPNIAVVISATECIFGMDWTISQVKPWMMTVIDLFGVERCMFGSHLPIAKLSRRFTDLYQAYEQMVADFSPQEKAYLFHQTAEHWFRI